MKKINTYYLSCLVLCYILFMVACNVARDNMEDQTDGFVVNDDPKAQRATVEEFKKLPITEQWKLFSRGRRDELRRQYKAGAALNDDLKKVIANDLDFEISEERPKDPYIPQEVMAKHSDDYRKAIEAQRLSPEEMWANFSEVKKDYIRKNIDKYPQFAKLIAGGN